MDYGFNSELFICAILGPEATMYVSSGSPWCVHFGCAAQRRGHCARCVSGGVWPTGWCFVSLDEELSYVNSVG